MSKPRDDSPRLYNFNPGPSMLPLSVLEEIRDGFMDFGGMSILEVSHRGKAFGAILDEARSLVRKLMQIPEGYHVLFLQGGATQQFAMVPMNLLETSADYAITGVWAKKAAEEAGRFGKVRTIFSSEAERFSRVPAPQELIPDARAQYLHITTNNTIYGSQYHAFPDTGAVPLIADMSSDILSRTLEAKRFALIYAGAQKNLGPAGVTLVVIRDDLLKRTVRDLPTIFRYAAHVEQGSMLNTPPVFAIYVTNLMLRWLQAQGGTSAIEVANREKAALLYDALDASSFYRAPVQKESRSLMNIVFTLPSDDLTTRFVEKARDAGMIGLSGHRSVGGIRASIYNAFPRAGVEALVQFMREFERTEG